MREARAQARRFFHQGRAVFRGRKDWIGEHVLDKTPLTRGHIHEDLATRNYIDVKLSEIRRMPAQTQTGAPWGDNPDPRFPQIRGYRRVDQLSDQAQAGIGEQLRKTVTNADQANDLFRLSRFLWDLDAPGSYPQIPGEKREVLQTWRDETVYAFKMSLLKTQVTAMNSEFPTLTVEPPTVRALVGAYHDVRRARKVIAVLTGGAGILAVGAEMAAEAVAGRVLDRATERFRAKVANDDGTWVYLDDHKWRYALEHTQVQKTGVLQDPRLGFANIDALLEKDHPQVVARFMAELLSTMPAELFRDMYESVAAYQQLHDQLRRGVTSSAVPQGRR